MSQPATRTPAEGADLGDSEFNTGEENADFWVQIIRATTTGTAPA